jgi:hypothetical protein
MILASREAQLANYGPPAPGLKPGDILAFHVRVRLPEGVPGHGLVLEHPGGTSAPVDPPAGGRVVFGPPYPTAVVTPAQAQEGAVRLRFAMPGLGLEWYVSLPASPA